MPNIFFNFYNIFSASLNDGHRLADVLINFYQDIFIKIQKIFETSVKILENDFKKLLKIEL